MPAYRSLLSDFFETENLGFDSLMKKDWLPPVNVLDTEKFYQIEVAAPGLKKEDFKVKIDDGILTISAEKKVEKEEKEKIIPGRNLIILLSFVHSHYLKM